MRYTSRSRMREVRGLRRLPGSAPPTPCDSLVATEVGCLYDSDGAVGVSRAPGCNQVFDGLASPVPPPTCCLRCSAVRQNNVL